MMRLVSGSLLSSVRSGLPSLGSLISSQNGFQLTVRLTSIVSLSGDNSLQVCAHTIKKKLILKHGHKTNGVAKLVSNIYTFFTNSSVKYKILTKTRSKFHERDSLAFRQNIQEEKLLQIIFALQSE